MICGVGVAGSERGPGRWSSRVPSCRPPDGVPGVVLEGLLGWQLEVWPALFAPGLFGLVVPRQNGKTELLVRRALVGALLGEEVVWTAHDLATVRDAMGRILELCDADPVLRRRVGVVRRHTQMAQVAFHRGGRVVFRSRTRVALRGLAGVDTLVLDEAFRVSEDAVASVAPTQATVRDARMLVVSSPGLEESVWLWSLRRRAIAGEAGVGWVEWTGERVALDELGRVSQTPPDLDDREVWVAANPAFGSLLDETALERGRSLMPARVFAREHLGVWDPPLGTVAGGAPMLDATAWDAAVMSAPSDPDRLAFAFDVGRDGRAAIVAASGTGGFVHLEVVEERPGAAWLPDRIVELVARHDPDVVAWVDWGAASGLGQVVEAALRSAGHEVACKPVRPSGWARACQGLAVGVSEGFVRHAGQAVLTGPIVALGRRDVPSGWAADLAGCDDDRVHVAVAAIAAWGALPATPAPKAPVFAW